MKKIIISLIIVVGFYSALFAQNDSRSRETKIADIVMLLPANNTATFNKLMGELIELGDVISDMTPRLTDSGDSDKQLRSAISGLAMYASKEASKKARVAQSLCNALSKAKSDEIRDFLLIQLQYVAGSESIETAAQYLNNARLADAAARVLVRIGNEAAGKALLQALDTNTDALRKTYVEALGDIRYLPAIKTISAVATSDDVPLRKTALYSLAMIADLSSIKILADAAAKAGYVYDPADALGSYLLFLNNILPDKKRHEVLFFDNTTPFPTPIIIPNSNFVIVKEAARKLLKATNESEQIAAKSAALELLTFTAEKQAVSEVMNALKSSNKQYRRAALKYSANIQSPKMDEALTKAVKSEKRPEVKAEIIASFGERGVKTAWPLVKGYLADKNNDVRVAAVVAAGRLAGTEAVAAIVKAMNTDVKQVVDTCKITLMAIEGDQVVNEVAAAIPQSTPQAIAGFLEILESRKALSHSETIFSQTSSTDANVRLAAFKALLPIVEVKDVPRIAKLLNTASNKNEIAALQQAFFAAISSESQDKQTEMVAEQAAESTNIAAYGNILAMVGGKAALDLVMEYGFNSGDANMKDLAFEALQNWSDGSAVSQLYKIAAENPSGPYFEKALNAYITKIGAARSTPEQRLLMLRNAIDIAKSADQKQNLLRQISRTGTFIGLLTAGKYLDDSNSAVQQAAVQAVRTIALAHPEFYGTEITALLNKAMAINKDPEADYQKQAILKLMSEQPKDEGFVSMFNGKDLAGWKGLIDPKERLKLKTPKQLADEQVKKDEIMRRDWKVIDGLLVFEGKGYDNLCSVNDYADFEMYVDWRIAAKGDAGIYLRGSPQVQIWDIANRGASVGSGGLFNNQKHPANPLVVADNPVNEWNSFYIKMIGEKVTVLLNGQLVVDNVTLENYWFREQPIFEKGSIELQAHGDRTEYRSIYVREIPRPDPYKVSDKEKAEGFVPMFNGIDMTGWTGNLRDYIPQDGMIVCDPSKGGSGDCFTEKEYSNFIMRFEFLLTPAANNGIGIRAPLNGDAAYGGMEIQVLDNEAEVYRDLQPYQYHGSVYGVIPAKRGFLKPVGEWNTEEIVADGNHIKVTLNGTVILDGDIAEASKNFTQTIDGRRHPGLSNKSGHIGFLGHGSWVAFRNLRIKELK